MAEAFGTLDANVCKVFTVHSKQVTIEQALFSRLIITVLAVMKFGLPVLDDELVRAQRTRFMVSSRVLGVFRRPLTIVAEQLVTFQVVVETDLLVGGEVAVGALVLLL